MRIRWSYFISRRKISGLILIITLLLNVYIFSNFYPFSNGMQIFPDILLSKKCELTGNGVISAYGSGNLGSSIFQCASVITIAEQFHLDVYLSPETSNKISMVFEKKFLPKIETNSSKCHWIRSDNFNDVKEELKNLNDTYGLSDIVKVAKKCNRAILVRQNAVFVEPILKFIDLLMSRFLYKRQLLDSAQKKLHTIEQYVQLQEVNETTEVVFVGLHSSGKQMNKIYHTRINYFIRAVDRMYNHLSTNKTIVFVVSCNDRPWCESELVPWLEMDSRYEVLYGGGGSPEEDLALLSSCNHSIIDYGLFGLWAAVMANGNTIVLNVSYSPAVTFANHFKNWTVLS